MRKWLLCATLIIGCLLPVHAQETSEPTLVPPTALPTPVQPPPAVTLNDGGVAIQRLFDSVAQGGVGVLRLQGQGITSAQARFRGLEIPFLLADDGAWYALLVADIDAQARGYPLSLIVERDDGTRLTFADTVMVTDAGFIRQTFEVPPALGYLIEPAVERQEFARLDAIAEPVTPQRGWVADGWQLPLNAPYNSGFGQYRILNETVQTRHTGWDQRAVIGTPVMAMAGGTVAYAGQLDIRGNYVMIDHGWGVYSGYAHLSQINVERGQTIEQAQIIGASGNTGRSQGPHLHWEIMVHGEWVDGAPFLETWLP